MEHPANGLARGRMGLEGGLDVEDVRLSCFLLAFPLPLPPLSVFFFPFGRFRDFLAPD